jgi:hypothetical protein
MFSFQPFYGTYNLLTSQAELPATESGFKQDGQDRQDKRNAEGRRMNDE